MGTITIPKLKSTQAMSMVETRTATPQQITWSLLLLMHDIELELLVPKAGGKFTNPVWVTADDKMPWGREGTTLPDYFESPLRVLSTQKEHKIALHHDNISKWWVAAFEDKQAAAPTIELAMGRAIVRARGGDQILVPTALVNRSL